MGKIVASMRRLVRLLVVVTAVATLLRLIRQRRGDHTGRADVPPGWRGPAWFRRLVTNRFDPLVVRYGLVGGRRSSWAFVEHVGRKSGTTRRTPILPHLSGDHVVVPLPYGRNVHWARNVLAAGHCRVQLHEQVYELDEPQILPAPEVSELPAWRRGSPSGRVMEYLRLRVFSVQPGTLDDVEAGTPAEAEPAAAAVAPVEAVGVDA